MIDFSQYKNPVSIEFGDVTSTSLIKSLKGSNILIFCSKRFQNSHEGEQLLYDFTGQDLTIKFYTSITSNPTLKDLNRCSAALAHFSPDAIIAIGGGSTLDIAKAYKGFISSCLTFEEYQERICLGQCIDFKRQLLCIAIPTTSGTGSEVTPFATIWDEERNRKLSINSHYLYFTKAFVDPRLTYGLPFDQTLYTSLDALNQAAESIWNNNSNFTTLMFACHAIKLGLEVIPLISDKKPINQNREDNYR